MNRGSDFITHLCEMWQSTSHCRILDWAADRWETSQGFLLSENSSQVLSLLKPKLISLRYII